MKVIEHFISPRNVGSMKDADGEGTHGDLKYGTSGQYFCPLVPHKSYIKLSFIKRINFFIWIKLFCIISYIIFLSIFRYS